MSANSELGCLMGTAAVLFFVDLSDEGVLYEKKVAFSSRGI